MRASTIQALREYWPDADDATGTAFLQTDPSGLPFVDPQRLTRLLLRAIREVEQDRQADRQAAQQAIQALNARLAAAGIP